MVPLEHASSKSPVKPAFKYILLHPKREELKLGPLLLAHLYRGSRDLVYRNINSFGGPFCFLPLWALLYSKKLCPHPLPFPGNEIIGLCLIRYTPFRAASGRAVLIF